MLGCAMSCAFFARPSSKAAPRRLLYCPYLCEDFPLSHPSFRQFLLRSQSEFFPLEAECLATRFPVCTPTGIVATGGYATSPHPAIPPVWKTSVHLLVCLFSCSLRNPTSFLVDPLLWSPVALGTHRSGHPLPHPSAHMALPSHRLNFPTKDKSQPKHAPARPSRRSSGGEHAFN